MSNLRNRLASMNKKAEASEVEKLIHVQIAEIVLEMYNKSEAENKKLIGDFIQQNLNVDLNSNSNDINLIVNALNNLTIEQMKNVKNDFISLLTNLKMTTWKDKIGQFFIKLFEKNLRDL